MCERIKDAECRGMETKRRKEIGVGASEISNEATLDSASSLKII